MHDAIVEAGSSKVLLTINSFYTLVATEKQCYKILRHFILKILVNLQNAVPGIEWFAQVRHQ